MPDNNWERSSAAQGTEPQSFPLIPFTDFSRLDKLPDHKNGKSSETNGAQVGDILKPDDIHKSIYKSPFQPADATKPANVEQNKLPADQNQTIPILPPFKLSEPADLKATPATRPDSITPLLIPPISDTTQKINDAVPKIKPGPDGKIVVTEDNFDQIGPKAKQVLIDAGVTKLTITPGKGFDTYEAELKKPLEIQQDPEVDGTRKLTMATHFQADVSKSSDGTLVLDNIQGLTAESKILMKFREAEVQKIELKQGADGQSEISSVGSWKGFSGTKNRVAPAEVFEKAQILFDRMQKLKAPTGALEIPPLPGK